MISDNGRVRVFLVDDDRQFLIALGKLLESEGYEVRPFSSAEEFLKAHDPLLPGCAVVDLAMPGLDGLALQQRLSAQDAERQLIFLSGRANVGATVRAMKAGAVDFLEKPVETEQLLEAIEQAVARDREGRLASSERKTISDRFGRLSPRESQVLSGVTLGKLNKQIAFDLGIVEKTVKVHRQRMMKKMGVRSVAELVRLKEQLLRRSAGSHVSGSPSAVSNSASALE